MEAGTVEGIPAAAASTFERLLDAPERDVSVLRRSVDSYLGVIKEAAQARTYLDSALAAAIATSCHGLIDMLATASEPQRRNIIAAVEYFLLPRDGEDDLAYEDGLDDDAQVVSAVARALGRGDLVVPVPVR